MEDHWEGILWCYVMAEGANFRKLVFLKSKSTKPKSDSIRYRKGYFYKNHNLIKASVFIPLLNLI
jgi:hypothetical protein